VVPAEDGTTDFSSPGDYGIARTGLGAGRR
jgi:hypothetical protein